MHKTLYNNIKTCTQQQMQTKMHASLLHTFGISKNKT